MTPESEKLAAQRPYIVPPAQRARNERAFYIPLVVVGFLAWLVVTAVLYFVVPAIWK